jgi:hypothetical protein
MDVLKKKMIEALERTLGRVTEAAESIDIARSTHYDWMQKDPEYKEAVESIGEKALDFVESKLFELIDGPQREIMTDAGIQTIKDTPNPTACIFYLKTKGKKRGYVERQEVTGADGDKVVIQISDKI